MADNENTAREYLKRNLDAVMTSHLKEINDKLDKIMAAVEQNQKSLDQLTSSVSVEQNSEVLNIDTDLNKR